MTIFHNTSTLLKSAICNNVKLRFTLKYILNNCALIFYHILTKSTYFEVLTNIWKHVKYFNYSLLLDI